MSCRLDAPISADELDCAAIYSRKKCRLQELSVKDRIDTDVLFGFMDLPDPEKDGTIPKDLYYGVLDAMIHDADNRNWEMEQIERWMDEYSGA